MSNSWQEIRRLWGAAEERPRASRGAVMVLRRHFAEAGIVERMARLERFCGQTDAQPFIWGVVDCSLLLADWGLANGHADAGAEWRGRYDDEASCRALVAEHGTLRDVVADCFEGIGCRQIVEPELGAVAVIGSIHNPTRQWGAIWNGARWLVKGGVRGTDRWVSIAAMPLGIWRI